MQSVTEIVNLTREKPKETNQQSAIIMHFLLGTILDIQVDLTICSPVS